jgi:hypothetical protein
MNTFMMMILYLKHSFFLMIRKKTINVSKLKNKYSQDFFENTLYQTVIIVCFMCCFMWLNINIVIQ